jgi:hypothetical protein
MTTNGGVAKRRARRIAADEAHAWARNLRLNNPHAKLVLSMLSQYVNGDGICWVGIPSLAEDCELAVNTVRGRLAWLEEIGAIARKPQWLDEFGRRKSTFPSLKMGRIRMMLLQRLALHPVEG